MITPTVNWPTPTASDQIGRTDPTRQVPPVGIALDQLEKELHGVRESVMLLEQRLSVVMRPIPANPGNLSNGPIGGSPLANQIESLTQLARSTGADVRMLLDCIEI